MHNKNNPYTPISAKLINNTDLTGEERFLLIYLLGRSDDYILNSSYFAKQSQELFGWGRDKFQNIWNKLQDKGYILKEQIREKGQAAGYHYKVYEVLKNRCPENPGSGKSVSRNTSALHSIDKPIIDKPITDQPSACGTTITNLNVEPSNPSVGSDPKNGILATNSQVKEIFELIREQNPSEFSDTWKLNDKDRSLIEKAINHLGYTNAQLRVYERVGLPGMPYTSVSYIFAEFKDAEPDVKEGESAIEEFLKLSPEMIGDLVKAELSDQKVESAQFDCKDANQFYDFIRNVVTTFHHEAKHWKASDEDLAYCEALLSCDCSIPLAEKLRRGLVSAFQKNEWRFGQIVYQAMTAIDTKEMLFS